MPSQFHLCHWYTCRLSVNAPACISWRACRSSSWMLLLACRGDDANSICFTCWQTCRSSSWMLLLVCRVAWSPPSVSLIPMVYLPVERLRSCLYTVAGLPVEQLVAPACLPWWRCQFINVSPCLVGLPVERRRSCLSTLAKLPVEQLDAPACLPW